MVAVVLKEGNAVSVQVWEGKREKLEAFLVHNLVSVVVFQHCRQAS